ncbi:hypothetical protein EV360DRAFT_86721 [Lentinula raphanica]|nr:hypothetical protein EV360DRAFT_86721 [Lentinula raphanica]
MALVKARFKDVTNRKFTRSSITIFHNTQNPTTQPLSIRLNDYRLSFIKCTAFNHLFTYSGPTDDSSRQRPQPAVPKAFNFHPLRNNLLKFSLDLDVPFTLMSSLTIRCELSKDSVWKALQTRAAPHIQSVIILPAHRGLSEQLSVPEILPPGIPSTSKADMKTTDEQASVERDLIAALKKMKGLKHFAWRSDTGPVLDQELWSTLKTLKVPSLRIIDHKPCDFVGLSGPIEYRSIFESHAFSTFTQLTSLEIETRFLAGLDIEDDKKYLLVLIELLHGNANSLEALYLTFLDPDALVDVSLILSRLTFGRLREITFRRASCTPQSLSRFLSSHPSIVSLSLSPFMTGRRWEQLSLPKDALPNLMHLNCTSYHAAKILNDSQSPSRPLFCLTGIDVRQNIKLSEYFPVDKQDAYTEDEEVLDVDPYEANKLIIAPWRDELFTKLRSSKCITHVALEENDGPKSVDVLANLMPQIRWLDVGLRREDSSSEGSWPAVLSKFPELRTLHMRGTGLFLDYLPGHKMLNAEVEHRIRDLTKSCQKLIVYEDWHDSVIIRRQEKLSLEIKPRVEPEDRLKEGLSWPSESFVRATVRKDAGPNQPGPAVLDARFN